MAYSPRCLRTGRRDLERPFWSQVLEILPKMPVQLIYAGLGTTSVEQNRGVIHKPERRGGVSRR
jgi:hypothetical protein